MPSPVLANDFEIEPMAKRVFGVTGLLASRSRIHNPGCGHFAALDHRHRHPGDLPLGQDPVHEGI